jgi:uncharacterized protein with von Willebrand factor type A (vWA) domain
VKARLHTFVGMLRDAGLPVSVAETLDALNAVRVVGIERSSFREGLAATLIKDEADRAAFDAAFDRCFPSIGRQHGKGLRQQPTGDGGNGRGGKSAMQLRPSQPDAREQNSRPHQPSPIDQRAPELHPVKADRHRLLSGNRCLQAIPFEQMSPQDAERCDALIAQLARRFRAHLSRRQRTARRRHLDIRRTIRRSISKGGVPILPAFRSRRPGAPDLVALCDCSHSVARVTSFLIGLLSPAQEFFRRVRFFAFVDQPVEMSIEDGTLIPHERLDLYARSDFGRVLVGFRHRYEPLLNRNTILLVLGDARNNRQPPRPDVLARIRYAVRRVVWFNPEPIVHWNTGDSVMSAYQRYCDEVIATSTIQQLHAALRRSLTAA